MLYPNKMYRCIEKMITYGLFFYIIYTLLFGYNTVVLANMILALALNPSNNVMKRGYFTSEWRQGRRHQLYDHADQRSWSLIHILVKILQKTIFGLYLLAFTWNWWCVINISLLDWYSSVDKISLLLKKCGGYNLRIFANMYVKVLHCNKDPSFYF